ncbi:MAG: hypothetical protein ACLPN5_18080 [Roseiarcus sp.]
MTELGVVRRSITRADRAATDALAKYGVATVHEAMGRVGLMKPYMRPICAGASRPVTAPTIARWSTPVSRAKAAPAASRR